LALPNTAIRIIIITIKGTANMLALSKKVVPLLAFNQFSNLWVIGGCGSNTRSSSSFVSTTGAAFTSATGAGVGVGGAVFTSATGAAGAGVGFTSATGAGVATGACAGSVFTGVGSVGFGLGLAEPPISSSSSNSLLIFPPYKN
jgi:hypothetical protein